MRTAGRLMAAIAAPLVPVLMLLPYYTFDEARFGGSDGAPFGLAPNLSGWEVFSSKDIVSVGLAVAVAVLAIVSFFVASRLLLAFAIALAVLLAGDVFPPHGTNGLVSLGTGAILAPLAAVAAAVGSVLALVAETSKERQGVGMSAPPGWYPDPAGQAKARYWDGAEWTDHASDR